MSKAPRKEEFPRQPWLTLAEVDKLSKEQAQGIPGQTYSIPYRAMTETEIASIPEGEQDVHETIYDSYITSIKGILDTGGLFTGKPTYMRPDASEVSGVCIDALGSMVSSMGATGNLWLGRVGAMYYTYFSEAPAFRGFADNPPPKDYDAIFDFAMGHALPSKKHDHHYRYELGDGNFKALIEALEKDKVFERMNALLDAGKRVLINCHVGRSRSVTVTAMLLMNRYGYRAIEALKLIQRDRTEAGPKAANVCGLLDYEQKLRDKGVVFKEYDAGLTEGFVEDFERQALADVEWIVTQRTDTKAVSFFRKAHCTMAFTDFVGYLQCKGVAFSYKVLGANHATITLDNLNYAKLQSSITCLPAPVAQDQAHAASAGEGEAAQVDHQPTGSVPMEDARSSDGGDDSDSANSRSRRGSADYDFWEPDFLKDPQGQVSGAHVTAHGLAQAEEQAALRSAGAQGDDPHFRSGSNADDDDKSTHTLPEDDAAHDRSASAPKKSHVAGEAGVGQCAAIFKVGAAVFSALSFAGMVGVGVYYPIQVLNSVMTLSAALTPALAVGVSLLVLGIAFAVFASVCAKKEAKLSSGNGRVTAGTGGTAASAADSPQL